MAKRSAEMATFVPVAMLNTLLPRTITNYIASFVIQDSKGLDFAALQHMRAQVVRFLEGLQARVPLESATWVYAFAYLKRFRAASGLVFDTVETTERVFSVALMLASKVQYDRPRSNSVWRRELLGFSIPLTELNTLETDFLHAVDFRLHVTTTDYDALVAEMIGAQRAEEARQKLAAKHRDAMQTTRRVAGALEWRASRLGGLAPGRHLNCPRQFMEGLERAMLGEKLHQYA